MSPFWFCPFSIETCCRNLSNPNSPFPINSVDADPTENYAVPVSITDFFIQQVSPVYAQVSSIVLDLGHTMGIGWRWST